MSTGVHWFKRMIETKDNNGEKGKIKRYIEIGILELRIM
jgi:hypothetical protein